jgi:lysine 2,3-aminomutase
MPTLSLDIPDGGGKAYYSPNFETAATPEKREFTGWDGVKSEYVNPDPAGLVMPMDYEVYLEEWNQLKNSKKS